MGPDRYTLLTGSTGLLGRILLADLLRAQFPVAVLIRHGREGDAQSRLNRQLSRMEGLLARTFPRPVILTGELTQAGLGLSPADQLWVKRHCDRVLHSGAYVSFKPADTHPDNEPFRTNVEGTRRLAEFCIDSGIREFHHISSAFSCGLRDGLVLESDGAIGQAFSNDYEASKCQSEELLRSLAELHSLTIYRPSIVIDPTPGSLPMGDRTIYLAFSIYQLLSQRIGLPDPAELLQQLGLRGTERKNIVPVAWVSRVIVQIMRRPSLHRQTYHLTHPDGTPLLEMLQAFHDVLAAEGYSSLQRQVIDSDFGELASLVEQFLGTFAPYFRDDPRFDQSQLNKALAVCNEPRCPDVAAATLQEIARQQLHRRNDPATDGKGPSRSVWSQICRSPRAQQKSTTEESDSIGLLLSGTDGGDWIIGINALGEFFMRNGGAAIHSSTAYMSTQTWEQLLRDQICLSEACRQGRVLLETAVPVSPDQSGRSLEQRFEQVLELLRDQVANGGTARRVTLNGN